MEQQVYNISESELKNIIGGFNWGSSVGACLSGAISSILSGNPVSGCIKGVVKDVAKQKLEKGRHK